MELKVENAAFAYEKGEYVYRNVNFDIKGGELLAVLGPNGIGKTTLLRGLINIIPLSEGRVFLDGQDVRKLSERELFSRVSYVPQAKNTMMRYSVIDEVLLGLASSIQLFRGPSKEDINKAEMILEELGIQDLKDKSCNEISGGELQMVLIAKALIKTPELLILDEPESNLDFRNQLIVLDTIGNLVDKGIACIFNTHYPEHALGRAAKSLILMDDEAIFGDTEEIINEANIERAFKVKSAIIDWSYENKKYKSVAPIKIIDDRQA